MEDGFFSRTAHLSQVRKITVISSWNAALCPLVLFVVSEGDFLPLFLVPPVLAAPTPLMGMPLTVPAASGMSGAWQTSRKPGEGGSSGAGWLTTFLQAAAYRDNWFFPLRSPGPPRGREALGHAGGPSGTRVSLAFRCGWTLP